MIAILFALAVSAQATPLPPASGDIVVVGERPKHLRIVTKKERGTGIRRCVIKPTSGDRVLDAGICDTYLACAPMADTASALEACMKPPILALVARRKAPSVR